MSSSAANLPTARFSDPDHTADGAARAVVAPQRLSTLWFNTGTLCNLACTHCYIESSPTNDALVYIDDREVAGYLDEIRNGAFGTGEIGFTGGEPFMNPHFMAMLADSLERGHRALVLTNAMRPMEKCAEGLLALHAEHGDRLELRVSIDHYSRQLHESERGARSWRPMLRGLQWLSAHGFNITAAGRTLWEEGEVAMRAGYRRFFEEQGITIDADDPARLILFPEMDENTEVPEITTGCWSILGKDPADIMCASSRMVVKRRGAPHPVVVACTLLPHESEFEMGRSLAEAWWQPVKLNHPHCATFCVLGSGACSAS